MSPTSNYTPPAAFGRFRLQHQIGAGVLGPVFRTEDPDRRALVAVKAFVVDIAPERIGAFADDLQRLADLKIRHPHIAHLIAAGVEGSVAYLAQQYIDAESLDTAVRQYGPAPAADAARLIAHIADALDQAAKVDVFHGSLHPRDILVTPGDTHVTGLGIAQALERIEVRAPSRRPYAAPERDSNGLWGAAADIYALAAIAYEILTGRRAMPGTDDPLPGLADLRAADPVALRETLEAAFDRDPTRRPATARELVTSIAIALLGESELAAIPGEARGPGRAPRRARGAEPRLPGLEDPLAAKPTEVQPAQPLARLELSEPVAPAASVEEIVPAEALESSADDLGVPEGEEPVHVPDLDLSSVLPAPTPRPVEEVPEFDFSSLDRPSQPLRSAGASERPARPRIEIPTQETPPAAPRVLPTPGPAEPIEPFLRRSASTERSGRVGLPVVGGALVGGIAIGILAGYVLFGHRAPSPASTPQKLVETARPATPAQPPATASTVPEPSGAAKAEAPAKATANRPVPPPPAASLPAAPPASPDRPRNAAGAAPPLNPPARPADTGVRGAKPAPRPAPPVLSEEIATSGETRTPAMPPPARAAAAKPQAATSAARPQAPRAAAPAKPGEKLVEAASMHFETRPPGARVLLDGREVGRTPADVPAISAGRHSVKFELDGYVSWSTTVTTIAGKQTRVTASMNRGPGK